MSKLTIAENDPNLRSFIEVSPESHFPIQNLPFGVFQLKGQSEKHAASRIGDTVVDLTVLEEEGFFKQTSVGNTKLFDKGTLNTFMSYGRGVCREIRGVLSQLLKKDNSTIQDNDDLKKKVLVPLTDVEMVLPVSIPNCTDFYSSKEHATNLGIMFRGKDNPLMPNWLHMPIGYDARTSNISISGSNFRRPMGQILNGENNPIYSESKKLCCEMEIGVFIGKENEIGEPINIEDANEHIFGLVLFNDWSARDIQRWEYQPLGPFLGKNFFTSISAWIVTLDALEPFRTKAPEQDPEPLAYLKNDRTWNFDIDLEILLKTKKMSSAEVISKMNFKDMYWDSCQQIAHHSMNGCKMLTGDILGSGTVSGKTPGSYGSFIELSWAGETPIELSNGEKRVFIEDDDTVILKGYCQGDNYRVGFGEVSGQVLQSIGQSN